MAIIAYSFQAWLRLKLKDRLLNSVEKEIIDDEINWKKVLERKYELVSAKIIDGQKISFVYGNPDDSIKFNLNYDFKLRCDFICKYYNEFFLLHGDIDYPYFYDLQREFRRFFPLNDRIKGIQYFDEMLEELMLKYEKLKYAKIKPENESEPPEVDENDKLVNQYYRIFPNFKCWQLFEYLKDNAKEKTIKAELTFLYWQMIKDKLMYNITVTQYTEWLSNKLSIDFNGYWKQLHRVNKDDRNRLYSMAKLKFQLNKSQY